MKFQIHNLKGRLMVKLINFLVVWQRKGRLRNSHEFIYRLSIINYKNTFGIFKQS